MLIDALNGIKKETETCTAHQQSFLISSRDHPPDSYRKLAFKPEGSSMMQKNFMTRMNEFHRRGRRPMRVGYLFEISGNFG